jgi:crotonobetainyl-CoA:carnitine CoA-transferase CaiB-like acyl-CoA transferase
VAARSLAELRRVPELADLADASELTERFARLPAADWVERLTAAGVGAHVLSTPPEAMLDEWAIAHGVSRQVEFPQAGSGTIVGPSRRLGRTPMRAPAPTPPPGWHGRELLEELGFGERVAELERCGAVVLPQNLERLRDPVGSGQRL